MHSRSNTLRPDTPSTDANSYSAVDHEPSSDSIVAPAGSAASAAGSTHDLSPEELAAKRAAKRAKIVEEIVDTERSFLSDMHLLLEIYVIPARNTGALPVADQKLLFGQLEPVIATSTELLALLEAATASDTDQWIGDVFGDMMTRIETSYCDYCKHNEAAIAKLTEYAAPTCPEPIKAFLDECRRQLQGRTGAWDLASLIVKPVQRVLKYPLLVRTLLKETDLSHTDYANLERAFDSLELVAEKINEVKKRKDIVEKYVDGKSKINVIHGITKKLGRGAQQLKKKTGLSDESTSDALYDALADKFQRQQEGVVQLKADLAAWLKATREYCEHEDRIAACIDELYYMDSIPPGNYMDPNAVDYPALVKRYRTACAKLISGPFRDAESQIKSEVNPAIDKLLSKFREPQLVMKKRDDKLLDFDRANAIRAKGDVVDKLLADSADTYQSINAQLIEELPKFQALVSAYVDEIMAQIVLIQLDLYDYIRSNMVPLADELRISVLETTEDIQRRFEEHMRLGGPVELATRQMPTLYRWRGEIWGYDDTPRGSNDELDWAAERSGSVGGRKASGRYGGSGWRGPTSPMSAGGSGSAGGAGALVDLTGSAPAPRAIRSEFDTDAVVRRTVLTSNQALTPTPAPLPRLEVSTSNQGGYLGSAVGGYDDDPFATEPFYVVALFPFAAEFEDEVALEPGMGLWVHRTGGRDETGDDWWYGEAVTAADGTPLDQSAAAVFGWFPRTFVQAE
ncbi:hypothetical protein HK105_209344 [Polyrhizophydium stewartii]|uniref:Dynamin-binding protein n=1 Tax=Polyrhizophydium stewartii TaxID=2732419 RepID=A0ABR4MVA1_9FUNG